MSWNDILKKFPPPAGIESSAEAIIAEMQKDISKQEESGMNDWWIAVAAYANVHAVDLPMSFWSVV